MEPHLSTGILAAPRASLACPHCRAGAEQAVVGLCWDQDEASWRCLLCGYRVFDRPRRSEAQVAAERLWEQMFPSAEDDGDGRPQAEEEEPEEDFGALPPQARLSPRSAHLSGIVSVSGPGRL